MPLSTKEYQDSIPPCCRYQTYKEHAEILLLCWSLVSSIKNKTKMSCGTCDLKETSNFDIT